MPDEYAHCIPSDGVTSFMIVCYVLCLNVKPEPLTSLEAIQNAVIILLVLVRFREMAHDICCMMYAVAKYCCFTGSLL